jgi:ferric-dicitrate binding protein FerR (iron transport regulator)
MKKLSRIEVEPLSDQRWSRIERSLMSRLENETGDAPNALSAPRRRVGGRAWLVAAALAGALVGALLAIGTVPERAVVEHPSRIATGANASHLALPGLSLDVEPQSAVVVSAETAQGLLIVVDRGSITCDVAPRPSDAPLIVQAGSARVRVLGTRFSVTRFGESARVKVQQGVVEVSASGRSQRVRAGETWPSDVARAVRTETAPGVAPPAPADEAEREALVDRKPAPSVPLAPAPEPAPAPEVASPAPEPSRQATFEEATALERSAPERALSLYASLESGGDS